MQPRESRVTRILRDARAAVSTARPETPRDLRGLRPSTALRLAPLPGMADSGTLHQEVSLESLHTHVSQLRASDEVEVYSGADGIARLVAKGLVDASDMKSVGVVDAVVRSLDAATTSPVVAALLILIREILVCDASTVHGFFASGLLLSLGRTLETPELIEGSIAGTCCTVLKIMSDDYAHAFHKFELPRRIADLAVACIESEVVGFMTAGCLAKVAGCSESQRGSNVYFPTLVTLLQRYHANDYIVARCAFSLASSFADETHVQSVSRKSPEFIKSLIPLAADACDRQFNVRAELMSLLVPLSAHPRAGGILAKDFSKLVVCIETIPVECSTMVTAMAVASNLAFFDSWDSAAAPAFCSVAAGVLFEGDTETLVETTRALGNVTRSAIGRSACISERVDEVLAALADHVDDRVRFNVVGCLINLSSDCAWRSGESAVMVRRVVASGIDPADDELGEAIHALTANLAL